MGWQAYNLNANFPVGEVAGVNVFDVDELDFSLKDTGFWIGSARIDFPWAHGMNFYGDIAGSLVRSSEGTMPRIPVAAGFIQSGQITEPVDWTTADAQWWEFGFGFGWTFYGRTRFLVGIKWEKFTAVLEDPRDSQGALTPGFTDSIVGDILTETTIPYFGLEAFGCNWRGSIYLSPFIYGKIKLPLNNLDTALNFVAFEQSRFSLEQPGYYVEGDFEYRASLPRNFQMGVWAKGSLVRFYGNGSNDLTYGGNWPGPAGVPGDRSGSAQSTVSRYLLSGGISSYLVF
ncbi:hypothetical protein ACFL2Q_01780 [Thermodesulfobacteriota bacterium]